MLEARVEMRLESQALDDGVMVAVYVRVYSIETFEHLTDKHGEGLGKWHT